MTELLKMHLQMFADGEEGKEGSAGSDNPDKEGEQKQQEQKEETFTKAQMEEIITKRVAREKDAATKKIQEAEKLAKMNADEKQKYEFEQLQAKLAEFEKKDQQSALIKEANNMFAEHKFSFSDNVMKRLVDGDVNETKVIIDEIALSMKEQIEIGIEEGTNKALTGKSPRMNTSGNTGITKTDFDKMGYKEKVELNQKNPDLYNQLTKGD